MQLTTILSTAVDPVSRTIMSTPRTIKILYTHTHTDPHTVYIYMCVLCPLSNISLLYQHFLLSYHNGLAWDLNVGSTPHSPTH